MTLMMPNIASPPAPPPLPSGKQLEQGAVRLQRAQWRLRSVSGWLVSLLLHTVLLIVLAITAFQLPRTGALLLSVRPAVTEQDLALMQSSTLTAALTTDSNTSLANVSRSVEQPDLAVDAAAQSLTYRDGGTENRAPAEHHHGLRTVPTEQLLLRSWAFVEGGFEGRTGQVKEQLLAEGGGSAASEAAVADALRWLAAHQRDDGSWRFNHQDGPCQARCRNPGNQASTTGATALALLPFLSAGHTPESGEHHDVVRRGVYYLTSRMLVTTHGGDLQEGTMYAQGLAAITLCEAAAMTGDLQLRQAAQSAIDFICNAQHAEGGWRYYPGQPGDTTVFGWQIMAIKSARMAGLIVPTPTIERARHYLDTVQTEDGAFYGYLEAGKKPSPTAIGLLSRMYYGWPREDARLAQGVQYLVELGPSKSDVYFNYYATQVLHHYRGPHWQRWNRELRDYLIAQQSTTGHEAGSWHFEDKHGSIGGRLYTTAMCAMILEVYYRYLPLYSDRVLEWGL